MRIGVSRPQIQPGPTRHDAPTKSEASCAPLLFIPIIVSPGTRGSDTASFKGSASPHLNIGALRQFAFRLPALDEQHEIVTSLDVFHTEADALKQLQGHTAAELEALQRTMLDRAFAGGL